ncbi:hypothetical protein S58_53500 [Bradyrhizobium oligotrophicum S58]|uniref:Uncharacterized protein n=1 Tax=Bradyrhizobium oligotrophicum S58 TaxID=1245469 RepID=M4ZBS4_9BRAD|nr:hypothetical protein S58_53500 [Bradyrhizobium oligotrophicum S58]
MIVVVVTPSSVIETSLTTVLPDEELPPPEELSDVLLAELVADDDDVCDVDEVDDAAVVAWVVALAMGVLTELIDMGLSREEETERPCASWRSARFFNADAGRSGRSELRLSMSKRRCLNAGLRPGHSNLLRARVPAPQLRCAASSCVPE